MVENSKKKAAAIAGVMAYIRSMEDAAAMAPGFAAGQAPSEKPAAPASTPWAVIGRNDLMQQRAMMQLKAFHGYRPR